MREDRIIEELLEEKGVVTAVLLKILVRFRRCSLPQCFILSGTRCIFISNRLLKSRLLSTSGCWREFHTTSYPPRHKYALQSAYLTVYHALKSKASQSIFQLSIANCPMSVLEDRYRVNIYFRHKYFILFFCSSILFNLTHSHLLTSLAQWITGSVAFLP